MLPSMLPRSRGISSTYLRDTAMPEWRDSIDPAEVVRALKCVEAKLLDSPSSVRFSYGDHPLASADANAHVG